jgi:hypothetical protein
MKGVGIMNKQQRVIIVGAAVSIFIWFNVATYWWVNSFDSLGSAINQTWNAITGNWMSLIILCDSAVFLILIFVWLQGDARQRGWTGYKRWIWIPAILGLGSPALLIYLVARPQRA